MNRHSAYKGVNTSIAFCVLLGLLSIAQGALAHSSFYWVAAIDFMLAAGLYYKVYIHDKA